MLSLRNGIPVNVSRRIIMDLNAINTVSNNNYYSNPKSVNSNEKDDTTKKTGFSSEAAVFEKSSDDNVGNVTNKGTDRTALINQLKADQEAMKSQLFEIVRKTISGQGKTIAQADAAVDAQGFLHDRSVGAPGRGVQHIHAFVADRCYKYFLVHLTALLSG